MKKIFSALIIALLSSFHALADTIILNNEIIIKGSIIQITADFVEYDPEGPATLERIPLNTVKRIEYEKPGYSSTEEFIKPRSVLKKEDDTKGLLLAIPIRFNFLYMSGITTADIYDNDNKMIASGDARFDQKMISVSLERVKTNFYLTPELGCFYRTIRVKDFSHDVSAINSDTEGYIPSIVTNPATGQEVPKDSVYSLNYTAKFFSYFLDIKGGANLVFSGSRVNYLLHPYVSLNLIEYRKTEFIFEVGDNEEIFKTKYKFNYFSSYGFGLETGMFFPGLRCGVKIGYDMRFMRKFAIPEEVKFKEVYLDKNLDLYRTKENSAKYTAIQAHLFTITAFIFI